MYKLYLVIGLIFGILCSLIIIKNNEIEILELQLKNKNNEIIKEINVCNNEKELESLKRQITQYKQYFNEAIVDKKEYEEKVENRVKQIENLEYQLNKYKNTEIKCLNEVVDKEYLKTIKGVINGKN